MVIKGKRPRKADLLPKKTIFVIVPKKLPEDDQNKKLERKVIPFPGKN